MHLLRLASIPVSMQFRCVQSLPSISFCAFILKVRAIKQSDFKRLGGHDLSLFSYSPLWNALACALGVPVVSDRAATEGTISGSENALVLHESSASHVSNSASHLSSCLINLWQWSSSPLGFRLGFSCCVFFSSSSWWFQRWIIHAYCGSDTTSLSRDKQTYVGFSHDIMRQRFGRDVYDFCWSHY